MESNSIQDKKDAGLVGAADKGSATAPFLFETKGYDPLRRGFHRVRARNFDVDTDKTPDNPLAMTKKQPSGKGYDCGCRSTDDFATSSLFDSIIDGVVEGLESAALASIPGAKQALDKLNEQFKDKDKQTVKDRIKKFLANFLEGLFFRSFMVHIPSWAPVNRRGYGPAFDDAANAHNVIETTAANGTKTQKEAEVEVEGFLTRSYLSRHHRPYTQWSRFYHWSFQVKPVRGFNHLLGPGSVPSRSEFEKLDDRDNLRDPGNRLYLGPTDSSLECMLDIGALTTTPRTAKPLNTAFDPLQAPSIHYDKKWPFWPQSGDYFWAAGRYVYDCTHPTSSNKTGNGVGLHPTLINPVKAFATSRYEAFKFDELDDFVPTTRFMFLSTNQGGYQDFDAKSDIKFGATDYEFIVDLPPLDDDLGEFAIGRTPGFNTNTIVARPRLLQNIEFAPYGTGLDSPLTFEQLTPTIQLVRPEPGKLPRQVRVKVPMSKLQARTNAYGFVLTLGWHDERQISKVRKVVVKLPELAVKDRVDHLRFNVCVNGRWIYFPTTKPVKRSPTRFPNVSDSKQQFPDANGLILHIPDDGKVTITAQGTKRNDFGEFLEEKPTTATDQSKDRRLAVGGIIPISDKDAAAIRKAIEDGLGKDIPSGVFKEVDKVKEVLSDENIKKVLGAAAADLLGTRRIVDWRADVDTIEADAAKKNQIASAVAREMKVFPVFNKANEPMGMVEQGLPRLGADTVVQMKQLVDRQAANQPPLAITYQAMKAVHPEETGFIFIEANKPEDNADYTLSCTLVATNPDPPPAGS